MLGIQILESKNNDTLPVITSFKSKGLPCADLQLRKALSRFYDPLVCPRGNDIKNLHSVTLSRLNGEVVKSIDIEKISSVTWHPQNTMRQFTSQGCSNRL